MLSGKTVIFGGSFSPPHCGHQAMCLWLREALKAKTIMIVPVYSHMFGKQLESFNHRVEMCKIMTKSMKYCWVSDIDAKLPLPNSTYNLLEHLKKNWVNNLVFVMGSDLLVDITKWHRWSELPTLADILVVDRPGSENVIAPFGVTRYPLNVAPTSSTIIRDKLSNGKSVEGLIPYKVNWYIKKHKLYGVK